MVDMYSINLSVGKRAQETMKEIAASTTEILWYFWFLSLKYRIPPKLSRKRMKKNRNT
ncbi:hypothetical protein [Enterococcus sp. AZ072]|uniref:hypothetical protein n=1 Tax=unclassified Enterococcus TaxID=2608891 RepID=UPI003D26F8C9